MSDYLVIGGWSRQIKIPVQVLRAKPPTAFWIKPMQRAFVPGRGLLKKGQRVLVPRSIVKIDRNNSESPKPQQNPPWRFSHILFGALSRALRAISRS